MRFVAEHAGSTFRNVDFANSPLLTSERQTSVAGGLQLATPVDTNCFEIVSTKIHLDANLCFSRPARRLEKPAKFVAFRTVYRSLCTALLTRTAPDLIDDDTVRVLATPKDFVGKNDRFRRRRPLMERVQSEKHECATGQ
jgi:hypothetical protein